MFYVSFVFDDSSRLSWLVEAPNERSAVNAILNKTKTVKKPKFVVVEKPCITSSDKDIDLLSKFESWCGEYDNVFHIENRLSEIVDIGGIKICLGSLAEYSDIVKYLGETNE